MFNNGSSRKPRGVGIALWGKYWIQVCIADSLNARDHPDSGSGPPDRAVGREDVGSLNAFSAGPGSVVEPKPIVPRTD